MGTRDRIVDTAIRLFSEQGTGPVSTNHIAAALGISPGNLYYHFRNKEEIVRAIYARLRPAWDAAMALPADRPPTIADLRCLLEANARIVWDFRFYYRELPALMRRDPALAAEYRAVRREGLANIEALLGFFVAAGLMREPDDPVALSELARICWLLADYWLSFEELGDDPIGPADIERGVAPILRVLHPYLTEVARAEFAALGPASGE
jgi:AcrR family transcriptional regulator